MEVLYYVREIAQSLVLIYLVWYVIKSKKN